MAIPTIAEAIQRGEISIYLASLNNAKGNLFGKRLAAPRSPLTIAILTDVLDWGNSGGAQTDASLRSVANYLVWLCGPYGQQAQAISEGSGGGSVTPVTPGGTPTPYDFIVTDDSFIETASENAQFPDTWIGRNIQFYRGGILQSQVNTEASYYTWYSSEALMEFTPAATEGELIQIYAV